MFDGYYKNPEATAAVVEPTAGSTPVTWASLDADGRVRYISRLKDMLKVGGENVACVEIENLLCSHPEVNIAAVVGVPHERLAEVPFAFVELVPNATVTEDELIAYCKGQIASFKVPTAIRFVTEWPMSATKIQKSKLRDDLLAERCPSRNLERVTIQDAPRARRPLVGCANPSGRCPAVRSPGGS